MSARGAVIFHVRRFLAPVIAEQISGDGAPMREPIGETDPQIPSNILQLADFLQVILGKGVLDEIRVGRPAVRRNPSLYLPVKTPSESGENA